MEVFPQIFHKEAFKTRCASVSYFACDVAFNTIEKHKHTTDKPQVFKLIPQYVKIQLNSSYKIKTLKQHNFGYAIALEDATTVDDYLQKHYNSKKRNIINRFVNRLEHCFNITYKLYTGAITEEKYTSIMLALHQMIVQRFDERDEEHKNLNEWDYLMANTYQQILENKASLFVIYNNEHPIEISLNYHFDKILFSYVSSYHTDYSKFGLGHVEIYKQLEWCLKNGYLLFEMGVGGMDYKRRWSNTIYQYQQCIIYNPNVKFSSMIATLKFSVYKFKEYLKANGLNEIIPSTLRKLKSTSKKETAEAYTVHDILKHNNQHIFENNAVKIDLTDTTHATVIRYRNDFLYSSLECETDTNVYYIANDNMYIFYGKTSYQKIVKARS